MSNHQGLRVEYLTLSFFPRPLCFKIIFIISVRIECNIISQMNLNLGELLACFKGREPQILGLPFKFFETQAMFCKNSRIRKNWKIDSNQFYNKHPLHFFFGIKLEKLLAIPVTVLLSYKSNFKNFPPSCQRLSNTL